MTEQSMLARLSFAFLLAVLPAVPALSQEATPAPAGEASKGPVLGQLLKVPKYIYAWQLMVSGETPPEWVKEYTATLDGPPVPTIPVPLDGEIYTLGFTCKPNDCENNQLYGRARRLGHVGDAGHGHHLAGAAERANPGRNYRCIAEIGLRYLASITVLRLRDQTPQGRDLERRAIGRMRRGRHDASDGLGAGGNAAQSRHDPQARTGPRSDPAQGAGLWGLSHGFAHL
jgi:hypothetical protein